MQTQVESDYLNEKLSENFLRREFVCPCCGKEEIKDDLVFRLQIARDATRVYHAYYVMIINSGWRCEKHNREVGGSETSAHLKGLAADIKCEDSKTRFHLLTGLLKAGFNRIEVGGKHIHVDTDKTKDKEVLWLEKENL